MTRLQNPLRRTLLAIVAILAVVAGGLAGSVDRAAAEPPSFCDINNDGFHDLIVGAPGWDQDFENEGAMLIYLGRNNATDPLNPVPFQALVSPRDIAATNNQYGSTFVCADFDADGFDDIAVGVSKAQINLDGDSIPGAGLVTIVFGEPLSRGSIEGWNFTQQAFSGETDARPGDAFGFELSWGDYDGDGVADLAASAPGQDFFPDAGGEVSNVGSVHIGYGHSRLAQSGVFDRTQMIAQGFNTKGRPRANNFFGESLVSANFAGDIATDLVVGAPREDVKGVRDAGTVTVIKGKIGRGLRGGQILSKKAKKIPGNPQVDGRFGATLFLTSLLGDSTDDLLIGAPREDVGGKVDAGAVYVIPGKANGKLQVKRTVRLHQDSPGIADKAEAGDLFGASLSIADWNGDGFFDLIAGVPFEDVRKGRDAGAIHVIQGNAKGLSRRDSLQHQSRRSIGGRAKTGELFATSISVGNFNANGAIEMAIGVPLENVAGMRDVGRVNIVGGLARQILQPPPDLLQAGMRFGSFNRAVSLGTYVNNPTSTGVFDPANTGTH
ncbi:MAG: hypothetical protein V3V01_20865, partial [Acidimicrobiales bacterium]